MKNFIELSEKEMLDTNGDIGTELVIGIIALCVSAYIGLREVVRDKGRADAYEDVSSGAGCYANSSRI